jgi:hypothetical protein
MNNTGRFVRRTTRLPLTLPIRVRCKENAHYQWTEATRLVDVNHFGAGFTLRRPVEVGRLIHLTIPMPQKLRCYDHTEPMYSVWSLIRHASRIGRSSEAALFRVGVGFVGKHPPLSYESDPTLRYDPVPLEGDRSLWRVNTQLLAHQRRETRLIIPLEVLVQVFDEDGRPATEEYTVTETLSSLGACVPTNLDVGVGRILKISSPFDNISIFAAIRSRNIAQDGIARLGLEFIGDRWPLVRD